MKLVVCLCAFIAAPALLCAQTFGEITGEVRDPSGGIIVSADIQVTNKATGAVRRGQTNEAGLYSFPALQPGTYDVTATKQGFQSMTRPDLELQVQQTARVDFAMQLGQTNQVVEVTTGAPLMTTENATVGSVIENKRIVELPLNGRNFLQLVSLTQNVTAGFSDSRIASSRLGGSRASQNISVAGQRSEYNHFTLDGVENTDMTYNTYVFLPSIDALQEFKVQTGIYPAEFGRAIAQVNVSTKSGTNAYHGALFEFLRNDKLDAKAYAFDTNRPPKDPFRWNQYGFTLGGPIRIPKVFDGRNRLFFMTNFDGFRDRKQLRGIYNVPYLPMRSGDFTGFPTIYDPTSRVRQGNLVVATPFPLNRIPLTSMNQKSIQLLEFLPEPNVLTTGFTGNRQQGNRRRIDKDQFTARIDFVESASSNWYGRYSWASEEQTQEAIKLTGTKIATQPRQEMISNSRVFSPAMVNEFRVSHTGFENALTTPLARVRDVTGELKIPGLSPGSPDAWGIPAVNINTFSGFGDVSNGPYVNNNHVFQFVDNFSYITGRHSMRMGVEVRRDRFNTYGNTDPRGTLSFTGTATENPQGSLGYSSGTGTGMADFLLGYNKTASVAAGLAFGQFRATAQSYYFDDTWRIHPKLTINLGIRYENTPPYKDKSQKFANIYWPIKVPPTLVNSPDRSIHPTLVRLGQGDFYEEIPIRFDPSINVARDGRLGDRGVYRDNNDFAPRVGLAWAPNDKWTIRSGFGMFYVQEISALFFDLSRNLAGPRESRADNNFPELTLNNPFLNLNSLVTVSTPSILGIQVDRRTPYTIEYMLNVQRQLTKDTVLEVGYLGSQAHKLQSWQPINEPVASPVGAPQSRYPFPEFVSSWVMSGIGNSNYHSLATRLQHRLSQGLNIMATYTWSKSIDLSSGAREHFGEQQFPQTAYCLQCERGLSIFNVAHRFVTSTLYELPFGRGKSYLSRNAFANAVAGGWQVSSIVTLQTGLPATVVSGYDSANYGQGVARPNATGDTVALERGSQDPNRFFNTAAFVRPALGTLGNVGRNTVIGPGIINWDFSALKTMEVRENQQIQFRFEVFNLPNHPNWGQPNTSLTGADFGKIRSTRTDMRDMQFALKYLF
jgi:hypothetical protein